MSRLTRRGFVAQAAAFTSLSKSLLGWAPLRKKNLGFQMYTLRDVIGKDPEGILKAVHNIGFAEIEATDYGNFETVWKAIQDSGLQPVSIHVNGPSFDKEDELKTKFADFKKKGFQYVVYPYVAPSARGGADVYKKLAAKLNKAGQMAKADGLQLCYHNHAFEFEEMGGTTPLQILLSETQKSTVQLELDIFWVSVAGHDPVKMLGDHPDRIPLLHLKDKAAEIKTQFNEKVPDSTFKEVGNGSIDIPAVLRAADKAGVKHYFVEQDHTPGDPVDSLRQSYKYLSAQFKSGV
jgi:sugar phosphate isomerase/epimerase